jgi:hypothetical protein
VKNPEHYWRKIVENTAKSEKSWKTRGENPKNPPDKRPEYHWRIILRSICEELDGDGQCAMLQPLYPRGHSTNSQWVGSRGSLETV